MPKYEACPLEVASLARDVMASYDRHQNLIDCGIKVGYYFAWPDFDEYGRPKNDAITVHGAPALARAKILGALDRAQTGHDAQILIAAEHWEQARLEERRAILDHELYHFIVILGKRDDKGRPVLKMRKHDWQFGWFTCIAQEHGEFSAERQQARTIMAESGQYFWPELTPA